MDEGGGVVMVKMGNEASVDGERKKWETKTKSNKRKQDSGCGIGPDMSVSITKKQKKEKVWIIDMHAQDK